MIFIIACDEIKLQQLFKEIRIYMRGNIYAQIPPANHLFQKSCLVAKEKKKNMQKTLFATDQCA